MVKNIPPGGINIWGRRERGAVLNKCIFIHFCRSGMGGDADLVRRLPIESVGTIVDEVGPCEKMGPLKKYPPPQEKMGGLQKIGRRVKRRCAPVYYPHNGFDLFNGNHRENPSNCV